MTSDTVHLILKYCWFDLIESGEKTVEYRDATDFYRRRLEGKNKVCFHRGYSSVTLTFYIEKTMEVGGLIHIFLGEWIATRLD